MTEPKLMLERLSLSGFKTIRQLEKLELGPMNVLIGPNGAGKSNLLSFFRMLGQMMDNPGNLQLFVGRAGGANTLLYNGAAVTEQIQARLEFSAPVSAGYAFRLAYAAQDTLIFAHEAFTVPDEGGPRWLELGAGHRESGLIDSFDLDPVHPLNLYFMLHKCIVHQFHNTSETARIRQRWSVDDNRVLKEDGANLAPFLLRIRQRHPEHYRRLTETLRQVAPFFADFELFPEHNTVLLRWREVRSDLLLGPHQASDGTLRAMALVALLMQPKEELPSIIILDEPELGLHPRAISVLAGLLQTAALSTQVIVATQSPVLLDHFEPEQVIVAEREDSESIFRRLDRFKLEAWLEEYTLSDLWDKNVLGGRPR
ncbi:MAG TPA: AAA family ATPase [Longimicrobium sp.]|nr:AAA family ATPase [Longimicrobium sp.]